MPIKLINTGPKSSTPSRSPKKWYRIQPAGWRLLLFVRVVHQGQAPVSALPLREQMSLVCNELGQLKISAELVQLGGLEPPTSCSTDRRSNQLSYNCILKRAA